MGFDRVTRWPGLGRVFAGLAMAALAGWAAAQTCAVPQNNGTAVTTTTGQTVNGYFMPANGSYGAGTQPTIAMSNARGSTTWVAGDMALLIQMQCVDMNRTESDSYGDGAPGRPAQGYLETSGTCRVGQYEYVPAGAGTSATSFVAGAPLLNTYVQANPTASTPRRSFQIVRVPQYGNLTLGAALSGLAWDGNSGGVLALDVAKTLNFNGQTLDMSARGFRGGGGRASTTNTNNPFRHREGDAVANATKAEGIAGTPRYVWTDNSPFDRATIVGTWTDLSALATTGYPGTGTTADYDFARGAPGNAGGGGQYYTDQYHNGGGGGGGNGGAGGRGAFGWRNAGWAGVLSDYSNIEAITGQHLAAFGGAAFGAAGVARVVMGGGGGAGDNNGNSGTLAETQGRTSGATGGGIVMVRAGALTGSGTIDVRGGDANDNPLNDAAGAGGAGGSVVLVSPNWTAGGLTVNAQGGRGGDSWLTGTAAHSGGGGGGGGVVVRTGAATVSVGGGANGITNTADSPPGGADHGALPGNTGMDVTLASTADPVTNAGYLCLPQTGLSITKVVSTASFSIGQTTNFTITVGNSGPAQATAATVQDVYPAGLTSMAIVSVTGSNAATTLTASTITGGGTFTGTVTIPVNQTLTLVLRAVATANGSLVNNATVTAPALAVDPALSNNTTSATVLVGPVADLTASKVASTPSLSLNATTNFTLTFGNNGPSSVTGARITDTLPSSMGTLTFVSVSVSGGGTLTTRTIAGTTFNGTVTLPVGGTVTVVLRATGGTAGQVINTTTIATPAGTTDPTPSNNAGTALVNIGPQADLAVTKSASPTIILDSQTTVFTITVLNLGPNTATGARLNDTLPSGLSGLTVLSTAQSNASATITAIATTSSLLTATMTLPSGTSVSLRVQAIAGSTGAQVNVATVSAPAGTIDPVSSNNSAQATVTIPVSTNLTITKTNAVSTVTSGLTTSYTITVNNTGPYAADGAIIADPAATGLSCSAVTCSATGGAVCPSPATVAALQGTGLAVPTFPTGSAISLQVTCAVTATGS